MRELFRSEEKNSEYKKDDFKQNIPKKTTKRMAGPNPGQTH